MSSESLPGGPGSGNLVGPIRHLYVHVPFCPSICPFCSFHVMERSSALVAEYLDAIEIELRAAREQFDLVPDTVYFGGGTPSYLRAAEMERLVGIVDDTVGRAGVEATLEVHPSTASASMVRTWVDLGFNRFSVGVQSFDDAVLAVLGRPNRADVGRRAVDWCVASGVTTSLDLITTVPGQVLASDLAIAISSGVDHISAYTLTIEEGTPFERSGMTVQSDEEAAAIELTAERLAAAGFERYEVSNHARPGARSVHNRAYWNHDWFLGVGPSAASFLPTGPASAIRCANPAMPEWMAGLQRRGILAAVGAAAAAPSVDPAGASEELVGEELLADAIFCGLRQVDGVDLARLARRYGIDPLSVFASEIEGLVRDGLVEVVDSRLRATDWGFHLLDRVAAEFICRYPAIKG